MTDVQRVALITGCGKRDGIGSATARRLASDGVAVVVTDVEPAGLANEHNAAADLDPGWDGVESLVAELTGAGATASWVLGDVSDDVDANGMVSEAVKRYGRVDILVNNAAAPQGRDRAEIDDVPLEAWDHVMAVGARGAFLMSRAVVPQMRREKWGRIISVSSSSATRPGRLQVAYATSKAAVCGMTLGLARDLASEGITANAVLPGPTRTSRALSTNRREYGNDIERGFVERAKGIPMQRFGDPNEIAAAIAYFASEDAAFTTGQLLGVDGGM